MRRVLIHEHEAVGGLGDDVGLVQLRPRRAQGMRVALRRLHVRHRVQVRRGRRDTMIEPGLGRLREAGEGRRPDGNDDGR